MTDLLTTTTRAGRPAPLADDAGPDAARPAGERTFAHSPPASPFAVTLHGERVACRVVPGAADRAPWVGLHGLGSDMRDLEALAARAGGPALLLDLPGFGRSARPDRRYPVGRAARAVTGLLDALGLKRPVWVGCSYGGHVALKAALDAPDRVAGLVLVDSGGLDPAPPAHLAAAFEESLLAARAPAQVAAAIDLLVGRPTVATGRFRARRLAQHGRPGHDYRAVARSARGALADDAALRLEEIAAPVELIHGERDALVPLAVVHAALARLPDASLTVLPGCGHMPWLEEPARVAARVRRAVERS